MGIMSWVIDGLKRAFTTPTRIDLDVPYAAKDEAKYLGAKWDPHKKVWFILSNQNTERFMQWIPGSSTYNRIYLSVPFEQKDAVRTLGASWDSEQRMWYIPSGVNPEPFALWVANSPPSTHAELYTGALDISDHGSIYEFIAPDALDNSRYHLQRSDGGFSMSIHTDNLLEVQELTMQALEDDADITLTDSLTGTILKGRDILTVSGEL